MEVGSKPTSAHHPLPASQPAQEPAPSGPQANETGRFCASLGAAQMFDDNRFDGFADSVDEPNTPSGLTLEGLISDAEDDEPRTPPAPVASTLPDIVPGLFPRETISLLVHAPHVGAKRFILTQLNNYANLTDDLPFLDIGIIGPREQLGMILVSGFEDEIQRHLTEPNLEHLTKKSFPRVKWTGLEDQPEFFDNLKLCLNSTYDMLTYAAGGRPPRFLLIESIHGMIPSAKINNADTIIKL